MDFMKIAFFAAPTIYYGCANNANARAFLVGYTVRGL